MKLLREAQGVLYELFDIHALDDMAVVIAEAFARYEPMAVIQGVSREELVDFVKLFGPKAAKEELSVLARDRETGQVIGAMLADDFASAPPEGIEHTSETFGPILGLLDESDTNTSRGKACAWGIICTCS